MARSHTPLHTQSLGQVGIRPAARAAHAFDAWVFRAASAHPFELDGAVPSCAAHDPKLFWPATETDAEQARAVCRGCPLAEVCLAVAQRRLEWGVWGGELLAKGRPTTDLPGNVRRPRTTRRAAPETRAYAGWPAPSEPAPPGIRPTHHHTTTIGRPPGSRMDEHHDHLPWVHGLRVTPDVHLGKGATVGSVIAMRDAGSPAAVGADIGCGMTGVRTKPPAGRNAPQGRGSA